MEYEEGTKLVNRYVNSFNIVGNFLLGIGIGYLSTKYFLDFNQISSASLANATVLLIKEGYERKNPVNFSSTNINLDLSTILGTVVFLGLEKLL
ncbi:hypothetical protein J4216_05825 [Candidatus Woesearchaeota archaeon]|nr:hypothetical protein [Candidatus Woesearchaeota archaeon]